jgi:Fe-Mn family superoxide dismutase
VPAAPSAIGRPAAPTEAHQGSFCRSGWAEAAADAGISLDDAGSPGMLVAPAAGTSQEGIGLARFERAPLPFAIDELEPWIGARTVELHYDAHHRGYVDRLNRIAAEDPAARRPLEELVRQADGELRDLAGQAWNHDFYWRGLRPGGGGKPVGALLACLEAAFCGFARFQRRLAEAANGHFGSGWAWLVLDERERLLVTTTHDGDNPMRHGHAPLYTIDVWEHAYYLDVQNERERYVEALIEHLIDWDFVLENLVRATGARCGRLRSVGG